MTTAFTSAIASRGIGLMLYLELSHPAELSETVPFAVKDRASRLKRGFPGTRHHEWLEALSKSMGFPGWNALAEASARLMDLVHPDGTFDPDPPIPAEFAETLVLVVEPNPESRPSDSFILELQAFAQKLASHSGQSPEALLDNMASWWGARNWSAFTTRDPALAQKPFYEFEVTDEFDMRGEPYSTGEWRLSSACQQAVRQLQAAAVALNGAGEDLVPFLRRAFDGHNGEQPVLQAGLALGNVLLERGQNEDALQVLKELDQRASTLIPDGFRGDLHYLIDGNSWYLEARYRLMTAHILNHDIATALKVCKRNTELDSRSTWWNGAWLGMLFLMNGNASSAVRAVQRIFDLDECLEPEVQLPFIVAAITHGRYEAAALQFLRIYLEYPDDVRIFLLSLFDDGHSTLQKSALESDVLEYLVTAVLRAHPKVNDVLVAWYKAFEGRKPGTLLDLRRRFEASPPGSRQRMQLMNLIDRGKDAETENWRQPLANIAQSIMTP